MAPSPPLARVLCISIRLSFAAGLFKAGQVYLALFEYVTSPYGVAASRLFVCMICKSSGDESKEMC